MQHHPIFAYRAVGCQPRSRHRRVDAVTALIAQRGCAWHHHEGAIGLFAIREGLYSPRTRLVPGHEPITRTKGAAEAHNDVTPSESQI